MGRVERSIDRSIEKRSDQMDREVFAEIFPQICRALGNTPPSRAELERIRLLGPPDGFGYLYKGPDRFNFRRKGHPSPRY